MITKQEIQKQIEHHGGAVSEKFTELLNSFSTEELYNRKNFTGHITASGIIVDLPHRKILLLYHKALRKWLSPGGHVQQTDGSILEAALREIKEETGIRTEELIPMNVVNGIQYCIEVNTHPIPANPLKKEKAHFHHDFQYVFHYTGDKQIAIDSNESLNYKWVSVNDPIVEKAVNQPALERMIDRQLLPEFEKPNTEKSTL